jgi:SOS-response transcriptional repressor LexA/DNA-binding XRE family transcriptional regulator
MIAERLRHLRREMGVSKRDLVASLPINYSTYANYESGFREPNCETLQVLSGFFDTSVDYILGLSDNRKKPEDVSNLNDSEHELIAAFRKLDSHGRDIISMIISKELERAPKAADSKNATVELKVYHQRASAGLGNYLSDDSDTDFELMQFPATHISRGADFCVRLRGDSMEPKYADGAIVYVKAAPMVEHGQMGIFIYEGEAYCKRLKIDTRNNQIQLESLNRSYAPKIVKVPSSLRTVGQVIGIAE